MSNITYRAKSLEDIAQMFDGLANNIKGNLKSTTTEFRRSLLRREIYVWNEAARILRQTKLGE